MWWSLPALPVSDDEKEWVEKSLLWLSAEFGEDYLREVKVLLPKPEDFPDPFTGTSQCVRRLLERVCGYLRVDPGTIELEVYSENLDHLREHLTHWEMKERGAAGQYQTPDSPAGLHLIRVESRQLKEPMNLVATLAHEVAHAILLGGGRVSADYSNHEPLTDLFTVFSGFGIFNANSSFTFKQYESGNKIGWHSSRQGYLSQEMYGYALASWAYLRNDLSPNWLGHLSLNVRTYMKTSLKYLKRKGSTLLVPVATGH